MWHIILIRLIPFLIHILRLGLDLDLDLNLDLLRLVLVRAAAVEDALLKHVAADKDYVHTCT